MSPPTRSRRWRAVLAVALLAGGLGISASAPTEAQTPVHEVLSSVSTAGGPLFTATNHLVTDHDESAGEYLLVWAGDQNVADNTTNELVDRATTLGVNPERLQHVEGPDLLPGNDFIAVVDADPESDTYGKVVNTVTVSPLPENEPHHMQYKWHKGNKIYAGALYLDTTYVFDVEELPLVKLSGVNIPTNTPCGSVPDAYWVLNDGTAYGTYMGGPDVPGPCLYTNGETRIGNGFAGTPGSLVRISEEGKTLSEVPADTETPVDRDPERCRNLVPDLAPSCANPHGIQVREDLNLLVTSDYAEPINVPISDPLQPISANLFRDTVRIWDISDRDNAQVRSVVALPDGPRQERNPGHEENTGIMETTVTNLPEHRGAFASSMCGGVIYYTPDITLAEPVWREVFDDTTASKEINPLVGEGAGCDGGGWLQTSGDDRFLYHAVIGRGPGSLGDEDTGSAKMVYVLDIQALLASGVDTQCNIDTITEVYDGGDEADCPALADVLEVPDETSGGPHWGALDNFDRQADGSFIETRNEKRLAVSNYFVSRSGVDGNHKLCIADIAGDGSLTFDKAFIDEHEGTPCVDFNRTSWPHGDAGGAKPHSQLFVVRDELLADDSAATGSDPGAAIGGDDAPAEEPAEEVDEPATPLTTVADASEAPTNGDLVQLPTRPVSSERDATDDLPVLLTALAAALVASIGVSTLLGSRAVRRRERVVD